MLNQGMVRKVTGRKLPAVKKPKSRRDCTKAVI